MRRPRRKHPDAADPERALAHFRQAAAEGRVVFHERIYYRLGEVGLAMEDLPDILPKIASEIQAKEYRPIGEPWDPPGHAFVFWSRELGMKVYLKFRLEGEKPVAKLYSLHPADY